MKRFFSNADTRKRTASGSGQRGFTLLELIVSLVLLGLLTAVFSMGIVAALNVYSVSEENVDMAQKAQLAMARINRELMELTDILSRDSTDPYLIYTNTRGATGIHALRKQGSNLVLYSDLPSPVLNSQYQDILMDHVHAFNLDYFQGTDPWDGSNLRYLSSIRVTLTLNRENDPNLTQTFTSQIHLRNTLNFGGATPAVGLPEPPTMDNYNCFIHSLGPEFKGTSLSLQAAAFVFFITIGALCGMLCRASKETDSSSGSALVAVIAAVLFFSAAAAALLPLVSTSGHQVALRDYTDKAYLMAESGYRYAASQYLNAGSQNARFSALDNLHNTHYELGAQEGQFDLNLYSYFYEVVNDVPAGATTITTRAPGAFADDIVFANNQAFQINGTVYNISGASTSGENTVTFTMQSSLPAISQGTVALPAVSASTGQTLSNGGTLRYASNSAQMFPALNGQISVAGRNLTYRSNDSANNRFLEVRDLNDPSMSLPISGSDTIVLQQHVRLESTGIYGAGNLRTSRKVTYHTPLPVDPTATEIYESEDRFDDPNLSGWASVTGTHQNPQGDNVVQVTGAERSGGAPKASLIALDSSDVSTQIGEAYTNAGSFLSYDAQIKTGFIATPFPDYGFFPTPPLPLYNAAGLSFRLDNSENSYGVSFLRGNRNNSEPVDNIDNDIVPPQATDCLSVVLWQQKSNGFDRTWLAYKKIEFLVENSGFPGINWQTENQWDTPETETGWQRTQSMPERIGNPGYAAYWSGEGPNGDKLRFVGPSGAGIRLPEISENSDDRILLTFYTWPNIDQKTVQVRIRQRAGWSAWQELPPEGPIATPEGQWKLVTMVLNPFAGHRIQFQFVPGDDMDNEDWYVDNVRIALDWPIQDATLLVRLKEAAALPFEDGQATPIVEGSWVQGAVSGARGKLIQGPIMSSGTQWAPGATGTLLLNRVVGDFSPGEWLNIIGRQTQVARVSNTVNFEARTNFIKVYYARPTGYGTPDSSPFNANMHANPRGQEELNWPPELAPDGSLAWTPSDDYFRLIKWDFLNSNIEGSSLFLVKSQVEPDAILRSNALVTNPTDPPSNRPELGLHTFGKGSLNTYFDDFGLQFEVPKLILLPPALQQ